MSRSVFYTRFLDWAVSRLRRECIRKPFGKWDILLLQAAWGNYGFMAGRHYLKKISEAAHETEGPILECGSGLTTILMGLMTKGRGVSVYALEHHILWKERVSEVLHRYGLDHVQIISAPLKDMGEYDWYHFDKSKLPKGFKLVICDGPPGNTKGSRYGLVPEMNDHLADSCTILLDDANRKNEKSVVETWRTRHGFQFRLIGGLQQFAMVKRIVES